MALNTISSQSHSSTSGVFPALVFVQGSEQKNIILNRTPFTVGRKVDKDLVIADPRVSRDHAQIMQEGADFFLVDQGSKHVTFVNGERIQRQKLERGDRLDTIGVDGNGVLKTGDFNTLLDASHEVSPAGLVSVMLANHETGAIQPIEPLAAICRSRSVRMHTDAVAAAGKIPINFRQLGVDALSVAAHKFQGPLGIGALVLRHDAKVRPMLFGGHQQEGMRPGDQNRRRQRLRRVCHAKESERVLSRHRSLDLS